MPSDSVTVALPLNAPNGLSTTEYVPAAGRTTDAVPSPLVVKVSGASRVVPSGLLIPVLPTAQQYPAPIVTLVVPTLTRCPATPSKVSTAFCPGRTVRGTEAPLIVIAPEISSDNVTVAFPVLARKGLTMIA